MVRCTSSASSAAARRCRTTTAPETDQRFTETKRLFEYGFNHLSSVQVLADTALVDMPQVLYADGRDSVVVRAKDNISVLLPDRLRQPPASR